MDGRATTRRGNPSGIGNADSFSSCWEIEGNHGRRKVGGLQQQGREERYVFCMAQNVLVPGTYGTMNSVTAVDSLVESRVPEPLHLVS